MVYVKFTEGDSLQDGLAQTVEGDRVEIREQWIATLDNDRVTGLFDQGVVAFVAVTQRKKGAEV